MSLREAVRATVWYEGRNFTAMIESRGRIPGQMIDLISGLPNYGERPRDSSKVPREDRIRLSGSMLKECHAGLLC